MEPVRPLDYEPVQREDDSPSLWGVVRVVSKIALAMAVMMFALTALVGGFVFCLDRFVYR